MSRARANPGRPVSLAAPPSAGAPAVCRAGLFQFAAHQTFTNGCVQSRALFWCKSGSGECEVNGVRHRLEPHTLYVLPWGRCITYLPSSRDPMYTAHVHLVPWYRPGARWVANIPHERDEPEFDSADRADVPWPLPPGVVRFSLRADDRLGRLVDFAVRWYLETSRSEAEARALGALLVAELLRAAVADTPAGDHPEELRRLVVHIDRGFHLAPTVKELAALVGRSRSHVLKLFRGYLGVSAKDYILERQLKEARELLLSTTLPISEVGRQVGQPDPYHFSKLFRRHVGLTPSAYRENHGPFSSPPRPSAHQKVPTALAR
jgi:AraC family transcriptional regulator of arabinose operon